MGPTDVMDAAHREIFTEPVSAADRAKLSSEVRDGLPSPSPVSVVPRKNFVDDYLFGRMEANHVPHAGLATDVEFLRRITLDLTGQIPDAQAVREFLKDARPDKRDRLIEVLLGSEAYLDYWTYWYGDLFHIGRGGLGGGADLFGLWIREQLKANRPYDQMVSDMLTASGKNNALGQPGFDIFLTDNVYEKEFIEEEDTNDERTVAIFSNFLGVNVSCISCHDGKGHVDKINLWLTSRTRPEFWEQAAFLGKTHTTLLRTPGGGQGAEFKIDDTGPGYNMKGHSIARPPRYGGSGHPAFLLTGERPDPRKDPREELARLLTSHPQFARATVNRFWDHFMGAGFVEPLNGFDLARLHPKSSLPKAWTIQPNDPELLEALANDFRKNGYDLRRLFRLIVESSAYQLSSYFDGTWKDEYATYYARKLARPLSAVELYDAIVKATGVPDEIVKESGAQAQVASSTATDDFVNKESQQKVQFVTQLLSADDLGGKELLGVRYWLKAFGQGRGVSRHVTPSILQPMLLMNHEVVKKRLSDGRSLPERLFAATPPLTDEQFIEEMYLSTLSRFPLQPEVAMLSPKLKAGRRSAAQDIEWALLNKLDFLFNY